MKEDDLPPFWQKARGRVTPTTTRKSKCLTLIKTTNICITKINKYDFNPPPAPSAIQMNF